MTKLYVIGIGYKPLDKKAGEIIYSSEVILASNRLFEVFKGYEEFEMVKDKIKVINNVDETISFIREQIEAKTTENSNPPLPPFSKGGHGGITELQTPNSKLQSIVLLASGDPMFFGIGRRAVREFGKDMVEILPDLSSIQMAFAKIKEPWDDAFFISLHGGTDPEKRRRLPYDISDIPFLLQRHNKIAILTDKENNPATIAKEMLKSSAFSLQPSTSKMFVCERLGYPDENITEATPAEIAEMSFSEPNVVIIQNLHEPLTFSLQPSAFGLKENEISHSRGLITKDEVRAVTIHKLKLPQKGIFWDIGSGSGSVSIETARLYPELRVFAIERDEEQAAHIERNIIRFGTSNIKIIKGDAPDALKGLPSPDSVFIGGGGGRLNEIVGFITKMEVKIVVINAATIETLNESIQYLENNGFKVEVSEVSISRAKIISGRRHMSSLNPVFVITGEKLK